MNFFLRNLVLLILSTLPYNAFPQSGLLGRPDLLPLVQTALSQTYNFEFDKAKENLALLRETMPDHPATPFLEALIIYWENFPMTPENPNASKFLSLMDKATVMGEKMEAKKKDDPEGTFFALFSRAFSSMFWSDNGKVSKVLPHLNTMYGQMLKGMKMKDEFVEFYFSSGLYNYYIEAYPEKHPAYKPVKLLFRSGNKKQGLKELQYCAENSVYLRVEARFFLSLIYLGYENKLELAKEYAAELHNEFPNNINYMGLYAETLLFNRNYHMAEVIINRLSDRNDQFSAMQTHILRGYLLERHERDYEKAFEQYNIGLKEAEKYSELGSHYKALALMGLSRYHKQKKDQHESSRYLKLAKGETSYDYILNDH